VVLWAVFVLIAMTRHVVIPLVFAMFFATLLRPPAAWLERHHAPRALAAFVVVAGAIAVLAGILFWAGLRFRAQADQLGQALVQGWHRLVDTLTRTLPITPEDVDGFLRQIRSGGGSAGSLILGGASSLVTGVLMIVLTVVFLFFLVKDGDRMVAWILERVPRRGRDDVEVAARAMWGKLGAFGRGQAVIAFADAVMTAIALVVIGVPLVFVLTVLTFFGGFIPLVGPVVATALAGLVALSSGGVTDALWVVVAEIVIQQVEGNVLHPVVMARAVRIHPMVVVASVTTGGIVAGIVGAFAAVPLVAALTAAVAAVRRRGPDGADRADELAA
jgi:predicted PurR-regulated permease PerM